MLNNSTSNQVVGGRGEGQLASGDVRSSVDGDVHLPDAVRNARRDINDHRVPLTVREDVDIGQMVAWVENSPHRNRG